MNDEPIFLLGAHKSGTTLLRSVFDGHPDLFVIPFESHFFQNMRYWVDYDYRRERPHKLNRDQIISRFTDRIRHLNQTTDQVGDSPDTFSIDIERFSKAFQNLSEDMSDRERFDLMTEAIYEALHASPIPQEKRVVEKSVEHAEFAPFLQQMYPKARFVHIVRNPYANIVSLRKAKTRQYRFPLVSRMLDSLYNTHYHLYRNRQLLSSYYIIRYEDLLTEPEREIKKMAEFLDLESHPSLLEPTKFGESWSGNSSTGQKLSGFDRSRIDSWRGSISPMEILLLNKLFDYPFEEFGYEKLQDPSLSQFLKPVKQEPIRRYLVNRWYLLHLLYKPGNQI